MTLGQYPAIKLGKARELALDAKHVLVVEKQDPSLQRKADREALTFRELADLYIEDSPRNVDQLRNAGHKTIVFANSTNRELAAPRANSWEEVEQLVSQYHSEWLQQRRDGRDDDGEASERPEPSEESVPQPAGLGS